MKFRIFRISSTTLFLILLAVVSVLAAACHHHHPATTSYLPPPPGDNTLPAFSSFHEAYIAGSTAAQEQRWQDALSAFNTALPLAQTNQETTYTRKWIEYVNSQLNKNVLPPNP